MDTLPILITGASGQVGSALQKHYAMRGVQTICPTRNDMDLQDKDSIRSVFNAQPIRAVISCAAFTAVDQAESEPEVAHLINAVAPTTMAKECEFLKVPLLHLSTDYVFDGSKPSPYYEEDITSPVSVYGRTKEAGERGIRDAGGQHAIIRTAWVLSPFGKNFLNTMIRLATERAEVSVVDDQFGNPTSAADIAEAVATIEATLSSRSGTWHFTNSGTANWYSLAQHIFDHMNLRGLTPAKLHNIPSSGYPTPARRPINSQLNTDKIRQEFGIIARPWQQAIDEILNQRFDCKDKD